MGNIIYTNVQSFGGKILLREVDQETGERKKLRIDYSPTLFVPSQKNISEYRTIKGDTVSEITSGGDINEAKDIVKTHKDIENLPVYGMQRFEYAYISDNYSGHVDWNRKHIKVCNIDIEVGSENGFPDPSIASEPITAITMKTKDKFVVFGCGDYVRHRSDVRYVVCQDENDLIKRFLEEWTRDHPDIITGWNVKFFDIPYLVNRIKKRLSEKDAKSLSPWNFLIPREVLIFGREQQTYFPIGIAVLDYIDLYKKFAPKGASQESYSLNNISHEELGEKKLSYAEYGNLHNLYKENYQLFIEYNVRDVELVEKLDNKLKLIDLALTLAYNSKTNYEDVFSQVRMWDSLIYNHLHKKKIVIPPIETHDKDSAYIGAFVKEPVPGSYDWVVSFDVVSLYPHLIMQFNVSPDTIVEPENYSDTLKTFLSTNNISIDSLLNEEIDTSCLKDNGVTLTPNGQIFRTDRQGFLPEMMEDMFRMRAEYKERAKEAKKKAQKETREDIKQQLEDEVSKYNTLQLAMKVCLNSAYGALGNAYFRHFDIRQASAITTSGQLTIRWIEKYLNILFNKLLKTENKDYVIAVDTDSTYLNLAGFVQKTIGLPDTVDDKARTVSFLDKVCDDKIQQYINNSFTKLAQYLNAYEEKIVMKREVIADRGIWTAKKRYILNVWDNEGYRYETPELKIMGLEMIKSSTPSAVRVKLMEAVKLLITGTEEDMMKFIEKFRQEIRTLPPEDIAFPRGVNELEKYSRQDAKGIPIHSRGSLRYNEFLVRKKLTNKYPKINEGDKIKFIYLKEPNRLRSNVISFPGVVPKELDLESIIDYDTQYEKSFLEPLRTILNLIGWKTDDTTTSLEDFFS